MKSNTFDLTQGNILSRLLLVALPVMGTQFMLMTYNLTDMFWLGRLSSGAVAASGTVGMYLWLSMAFLMLGRVGSEIGVSQNLGRGDPEAAQSYAHVSCILAAVLGIAFAIVMALLRSPLIGFFNIRETGVVADAELYLLIISIGIPFTFVTSAVTGAFSGSGNTQIPFYMNTLGLVINMALDPLFIFTFDMGIAGAAIASVVAQVIVCFALIAAMKISKHRPFERFIFCKTPDLTLIPQIFKWGTPVALESLLFTFLSMIISRFVASYGSNAIAAQRVGSQIESLSWLIAGGFSSAVTAFIGQNYGAGKWTRIHKGYRLSIISMLVWGALITVFLLLGARTTVSAFLHESETIEIGVSLLKILAVAQIAGCIEFTTAGCFRGLGRTLPPSIASISCNAFRVILAYFFGKYFGLDGIWWAVSLGAVLRGVWIFLWYMLVRRKLPVADTETA